MVDNHEILSWLRQWLYSKLTGDTSSSVHSKTDEHYHWPVTKAFRLRCLGINRSCCEHWHNKIWAHSFPNNMKAVRPHWISEWVLTRRVKNWRRKASRTDLKQNSERLGKCSMSGRGDSTSPLSFGCHTETKVCRTRGQRMSPRL